MWNNLGHQQSDAGCQAVRKISRFSQRHQSRLNGRKHYMDVQPGFGFHKGWRLRTVGRRDQDLL
jgi:hypothetical protein